MKINFVATLPDGRKVEAATRKELRELISLSGVADKLFAIALSEDESLDSDEFAPTVAKVCLALAARRQDTVRAYVSPRKKRS